MFRRMFRAHVSTLINRINLLRFSWSCNVFSPSLNIPPQSAWLQSVTLIYWIVYSSRDHDTILWLADRNDRMNSGLFTRWEYTFTCTKGLFLHYFLILGLRTTLPRDSIHGVLLAKGSFCSFLLALSVSPVLCLSTLCGVMLSEDIRVQ